jgi:hypothetical protein
MASEATNRLIPSGRQGPNAERRTVYSGDSLRYNIQDYRPSPHQVPYGETVEGKLFDGYPQIGKKQEGRSSPLSLV